MQGCTDVKAVVAENRKLEPYVVVVVLVEEDTLQAYLVVDNRILDHVDIVDLPFVLMAALFCLLPQGL